MITKSALQKILKGILHSENENMTMERWELLNLNRIADKELETSIKLASHTQTLTIKWQELPHISQY
jgi:hypothetical protein